MRSRRLLLAALALQVACASGPDPTTQLPGPRGDAKTLTRAELANATQISLLDYIVAERPQWLRTPDGRVADVTVYVDDARLGGPATLKSVTLGTVTLARYYETSAAQQRFGVRDRGPVIQVLTK
jgi:hypothetical protein